MSQSLTEEIRNEILGRILTDEKFRTELLANPAQTLQSANYPLDQLLLQTLEQVDRDSLEKFVEDYARRFIGSDAT